MTAVLARDACQVCEQARQFARLARQAVGVRGDVARGGAHAAPIGSAAVLHTHRGRLAALLSKVAAAALACICAAQLSTEMLALSLLPSLMPAFPHKADPRVKHTR